MVDYSKWDNLDTDSSDDDAYGAEPTIDALMRPPLPPAASAMMPRPRRLFNDESLLKCGVQERELGQVAADECRAKLLMGSDPNSCNRIGQTALHVAGIWGAVHVGRALVEGGADVDRRNNANPMGRLTPLMSAAGRNQIEFAQLLLEFGADPAARDDSGRAAWEHASDARLRVLLGGPSAELCEAVVEGDLSRVADLGNRKPQLLGAKDGDGNTPLALAIEQSKWTIADWLLDRPAAADYVNVPASGGQFPLHLAARMENPVIVEALLKAGADPNLKSIRRTEYTSGKYDKIDPATGQKVTVPAEHQTALFECVHTGNCAIAKVLIQGGADVDATDGDGCTALYTALDLDLNDMAALLLSNGASPDIGCADIGFDNTLLAWAASRRRLDHVQLLLKHGADPNKPGKSSMYPLHMAARVASKAITEALLAAGADAGVTCPVSDTKHPNARHATASQIAEKNKRPEASSCVEMLRAAESNA